MTTTEQLSKYLMERGVLKNADADRMAKRIAGMFEKERDQLAAKCAEMRRVLEETKREHMWEVSNQWFIMRDRALSSDCGKGWLSPEKAQRLRDGLERMAGYAATVRLDRRKVIDDCVMCLQTEDWCNGLLERVEESGKVLSETK